jgi:CspA family cold shock protein
VDESPYADRWKRSAVVLGLTLMSAAELGETTGTVVAFDEERGTGGVRAKDGRELFFHCTAIADGSRRIAVGAHVAFRVVAGHLGRWEAGDIRTETP